jgi:hypothetical protein
VERDVAARFADGGSACGALAALLEDAPPAVSTTPSPRRPSTPEAFEATLATPAAMLERLYEGPDFSLGRIRDVLIIRWWRTPTVAACEELDRAMTRALLTGARTVVLPVVDTSVAAPTGAARAALEDVIAKQDRMIDRVVYVVLGTGFQAAAIRAVITGMVLAKRPRHRTTVYPTVSAAVAALGPRPDAVALIAGIERFARREAPAL